MARERLAPGVREALLGDLFRLQYEENHGGMLSLGSELAPSTRFLLFTVSVGTLLAILLLYATLSRSMPSQERGAIALVAGGGIGNLIDRLAYNGAVIDFLNVGIGGLRTAIFNVADVAVFLGAAMLIIRVLGRMARQQTEEP
jgi:signal peptidase II